jgi:peptide-methionine (S)-S-oxide reductase
MLTPHLSASLALVIAAAAQSCQPSPNAGRAPAPSAPLSAASEAPPAPPEAVATANAGASDDDLAVPEGRRRVGTDPGGAGRGTPLAPEPGHALAAFAAGCFWGVEDAFRQVRGVTATAVGYTGGHTDAPTYASVCTHTTGHAETVLVEFDPAVISYERLLRAFFQIHDPTTPDRQGPDVGDQYRSAIFTLTPEQADAARAAIAEAQPGFTAPIVTKVEPLGRFWIAEGYHQQYAERTGFHGCPAGKVEGI